jgi:hypothetical protein
VETYYPGERASLVTDRMLDRGLRIARFYGVPDDRLALERRKLADVYREMRLLEE